MLNSHSKEILDITIARLTQSPTTAHQEQARSRTSQLGSVLCLKYKTGLEKANRSVAVMKGKFEERLSALGEVKAVNSKIKLSSNQKTFLRECSRWLQKGMDNQRFFNDDNYIKEFKLTESNDIFKGEHNGTTAHGHGI